MPGLLIFIVSILVVYFLAPHATPMIAAILSIVFLLYGVYDHRRLFASEYQLSTWQEQLKIYSPALMIIAVILFIIYTILAVFTNGSVPIPEMPSIPSIPSANSITHSITNSLNNVSNTITNAIPNSISNTFSNNVKKSNGNNGRTNGRNNGRANGRPLSVFEAI